MEKYRKTKVTKKKVWKMNEKIFFKWILLQSHLHQLQPVIKNTFQFIYRINQIFDGKSSLKCYHNNNKNLVSKALYIMQT